MIREAVATDAFSIAWFISAITFIEIFLFFAFHCCFPYAITGFTLNNLKVTVGALRPPA